MAEKRPSDRKSAMLTVRLTKAERAAIRKLAHPSESLSDVVRRRLLTEHKDRPNA